MFKIIIGSGLSTILASQSTAAQTDDTDSINITFDNLNEDGVVQVKEPPDREDDAFYTEPSREEQANVGSISGTITNISSTDEIALEFRSADNPYNPGFQAGVFLDISEDGSFETSFDLDDEYSAGDEFVIEIFLNNESYENLKTIDAVLVESLPPDDEQEEDEKKQVEISLGDPDSATNGAGESQNQVPQIEVSEAITYDMGNNYEFIITDTETNSEIITVPPIQETTGNRVILNNPTGIGIREAFNFWIPGVTDGPVEAEVSSEGSVTTSGVANLRVSLIDASTGDVIDQTDTKPYVIGYVADYDQDSTSGTIELSVNQSSLPADSSVTATVFNSNVDFPDDTDDQNSVSLTHDESESNFIGSFASADLAGGSYDIQIVADLPPEYGTEFTTINQDVITVGENQEETEAEPNAEFTFSPSPPEVNQQVAFNAGASAVENGVIASYSWDFGDGSTASGESTAHTFDEDSGYNIELTIETEDGTTDTARKTITVEEAETEEGDDTGGDDNTVVEVPGFGIGSALASLGGAGYVLKRRVNTEEE